MPVYLFYVLPVKKNTNYSVSFKPYDRFNDLPSEFYVFKYSVDLILLKIFM